MTPFETFFDGEWRRMIETAELPDEAFTQPPAEKGLVSWDRRAAWLLWSATGRSQTSKPKKKHSDLDDLL